MSRCALPRSATPYCSDRQREIQKRDEEWQRKKTADGSGTRSGPCYAARLGVGVGVAVTVVWEKTGSVSGGGVMRENVGGEKESKWLGFELGSSKKSMAFDQFS
ncbi:Hypothetical predicted protein [Olea europaea subsp. europaea]|uniref:Uncharacterized protein n=1 Tax=Olea europaea subsp. europaea TaxID=158383 RepID=A0A8S0S596_OLEEU|nr:Hypothetical predicted protein [Olea europaea subsp. europaea]